VRTGIFLLDLIFDIADRIEYKKKLKEFKNFELSVENKTRCIDKSSHETIEIEAKGMFPFHEFRKPVGTSADLSLVASVFDKTDDFADKPQPVYSLIEQFQSVNSGAYFLENKLGWMTDKHGLFKWTPIITLFPELFIPPFSGKRDLDIVVLITNSKPITVNNYKELVSNRNVLWKKELFLSQNLKNKGYIEIESEQINAGLLATQLGVAIALADGSLDEEEGRVIKNWMTHRVYRSQPHKRDTVKAEYNTTLRESYKKAKSGRLNIGSLLDQLDDFGDSIKYEVLEFCYEILSADGKGDAKEFQIINQIVERLNLNEKEVSKIRDLAIVNLAVDMSQDSSLEVLLGINPDWSKDRIKKYLNNEFSKWNDRLNTISDDSEREKIQERLDMISKARKNYV
jgi:tellurite resistance protein